MFQPTVVVAPSAHRAWRPAKSAEPRPTGTATVIATETVTPTGTATATATGTSAPEIVVQRLRVTIQRSENDVADEQAP